MPFIIRLRSLRRDQPVSNRNPLLKPRRLFIAITFALAPLALNAQDVIYSHESSMHVTVNSQGLGLGYKHGRIHDIDKTTYWDFEISYLRSLKQLRLTNLFSASSFIYGKMNEALALRGAYEVSRRIYGKPYWGGVELRWLYGVGAELALLKPYYYSVLVAEPTSAGTYTQTSKYDTFDHSNEWIEIVGRAPFTYGLSEIKFRPGIFARGGIEFEIGTTRTRVRAFEAGIVVEYYPQGILLMANRPASFVIPTLYLSYSWGSRYNKY